MKILLTGIEGQVGGDLLSSLQGIGEIIPVAHQDMHLEDFNQTRRIIRRVAPDIIIHPAAYTSVKEAEYEAEKAIRINAEASDIIAQEAHQLGAAVIYYSTDYVFDGKKTSPYTEDDQPAPINAYGQSKYQGEVAVATQCEAHWILRTSWVYSVSGQNFLNTMLKLFKQQTSLNVVADQIGTPTWSATISDITRRLLQQALQTGDPVAYIKKTAGIYHLTAQGSTSWHDYATFIWTQCHQHQIPLKVMEASAIIPVNTNPNDMPHRPLNSRLSTQKLTDTFGIQLPTWQEDVELCLTQIIQNQPAA